MVLWKRGIPAVCIDGRLIAPEGAKVNTMQMKNAK
jgi:hypothetical protein